MIAKSQINEIKTVLYSFMPEKAEVDFFLLALKSTQAYEKNKSFRDTIDLLQNVISEES